MSTYIHQIVQTYLPSSNWVNAQTMEFIKGLSFNGYVLAGNSVANMIEMIPLQGDLDFWVNKTTDFVNAFNEMSQHYQHFNIYPSMIELFNSDNILPRINLIYSNLEPTEVVYKFDWDYCRCYWTPRNQIYMANECSSSILSKNIKYPRKNSFNRILKALKYGYRFTESFWFDNKHLIANPEIKPTDYSTSIMDIKIEDLDLKKFELRDIEIKVSDMTNIVQTLDELATQYHNVLKLNINEFNQFKLPVLLTFDKESESFGMIEKYIESIVFNNPLTNTNYMDFKIGSYLVFYYNKFLVVQDDDKAEEVKEVKPYKSINDTIEKSQYSFSFSDSDSYSDEESKPVVKSIFKKNTVEESTYVKRLVFTDMKTRVIQLNESGTSYLHISFLPEGLSILGIQTFNDMWNLHPKQKHKIIMYEKEVEVNRYSQSYLNTPNNLEHTVYSSYMYSGYDTTNNNQNLPELFEPYYKYMVGTDNKFNQVITNWYEDENDFIAPHSDCQRQMIPDAKISILSLYPSSDTTQSRWLKIMRKTMILPLAPCAEPKNILANTYFIRLDHGMIVSMCGDTQNEFKHGIDKMDSVVGPRISLSFRQMIQ